MDLLHIKTMLEFSTEISITNFLVVSNALFILGFIGLLFFSANIIKLLLSFELMILAINLNFLFFSIMWENLLGQVFALHLLTVAGAESAIGLAIFIVYFRLKNQITTSSLNLLKG